MIIRTLRLEDLSAMITLDHSISGEDHSEYFKEFEEYFGSDLMFGAFDSQQKMFGFLIASIRQQAFGQHERIAYLEMIEVDPSEQKKGIGFTLMREFEKRIKNLEIKRVITIVNWSETNLLAFFRSQGFNKGEMIQLELNLS